MAKSEQPSIFSSDPSPVTLTVLVFPGCSIMCVASTIDPMRAANRIMGRTVFDWTLVSPDGSPPVTTSGLPVVVSGKFDPSRRTDVLIAIGGFGTREETASALVGGFRRAARASRAVGGVEAGGWLLGRAGLLDGRSATTHWEDFEPRCGPTATSSTARSSPRAAPRRPST
jgi:transcriptional regulator GlxA family with amidase domain